MLDIPFVCRGTQTLKIKETDRINALSVELKKFGYLIESETPDVIVWNKKKIRPLQLPVVETYDDHRMAMCFAPVALLRNQILIADPLVVAKSYPSFWEDLRMAGFQVEACVDR
jgi:3-phosphoshikimate 1-carboxyvinyltransferase